MRDPGLRGWLVKLADGRRFNWNEEDGIHSEQEARARLMAQEPDAVIVEAYEIEVLVSIDAESWGSRWC